MINVLLSEYYIKRTTEQKFNETFTNLLDELKEKKIIIYGCKTVFDYLCEKFYMDNLNIVAIADKKLAKNKKHLGYKTIQPKDIIKEDYDSILIIEEDYEPIIEYLTKNLKIDNSLIKIVLKDSIEEERTSFLYLKKHNFAKNLIKLEEKLQDKKIVLYGAGIFLDTIMKYYDLSKLNIIGISDRRFKQHEKDETYHGFTVLSPEEIININPEYVLVTTKFYINIIYDIYKKIFKQTNIKLKPIVKKTLWQLIQEL